MKTITVLEYKQHLFCENRKKIMGNTSEDYNPLEHMFKQEEGVY